MESRGKCSSADFFKYVYRSGAPNPRREHAEQASKTRVGVSIIIAPVFTTKNKARRPPFHCAWQQQ